MRTERTEKVTNNRKRAGQNCNSPKLARAMRMAVVEEVAIARSLVRKAIMFSTKETNWTVFCGSGEEFSYSVYARKYCEVRRDGVICVAFK